MSKFNILDNTKDTQQKSKSPSIVADKNFGGNVAFITMGCSKNKVDSEVMLGALQEKGFRSVPDPQDADLIVINTCAFLQSAVEEGINTVLEMAKYKKEGRCKKLFVAGCMVERYRSDLAKEFPEVDRFISTDELQSIANLDQNSEIALDQARRPYFIYDENMPRVISDSGYSAHIKISEGCNRRCTFCIIPKIRGDLRSRSVQSIVNEITNLRSQGISEFSLIAQDLTAYGTDFEGNRGIKSELHKLINEISKISSGTESFWTRLHYAYPIGVNEELISAIRDLPNICNYLDIPLQHISSNVLKQMHRPLGGKGTRKLVEMMRTVNPELKLRTTLIAGFPGETDEEFEELENFIKEGHFQHVGVFSYSEEPGTPAAELNNQIPVEIREERRERLMLAQKAVLNNKFSEMINKSIKVLVDGFHEESDLLIVGRTEWQAPETDGNVIINDINPELLSQYGIKSDSEFDISKLQGKYFNVKITDFTDYDLIGSIE